MADKPYLTYAKEHGLTDTKKAEELFGKAEKEVEKSSGKSISNFSEDDWTHVMGIFKKMVGNIKESSIKLTKNHIIEGIIVSKNSKIKLKEDFATHLVPEAVQKVISNLERGLNVSIGLFPFPFEGSGGMQCYKVMLGDDNYPITLNFKGGALVSIGKLDSMESEEIVQEIEFKNKFILGILDEIEKILERYLFDGYFSYPEEYEDWELIENVCDEKGNTLKEDLSIGNILFIERYLQKDVFKKAGYTLKELRLSSKLHSFIQDIYGQPYMDVMSYYIIDSGYDKGIGYLDLLYNDYELNAYIRNERNNRYKLFGTYDLKQNKANKINSFVHTLNVLFEDIELDSSTKLVEMGRKENDAFARWAEDEVQAKDLLTDMRISKVYNDYFLPWASENKSHISNVSFYQKALQFLIKNKLENKYSKKTTIIDGGGKIKIVDEPKDDKAWDEMIANSEEGAFNDVKMAIKALAAEAFNSIYIYGTAGVGKTENVEKFLKEEGLAYFPVSGLIKDVKSLVKVLYDHRDNEILLFDDTNLIKNKGFREILLSALEDRPSRTISYFDSKEMNKTRNKIPDQFEFTSGVIFISNESRIDPAIRSRSVVIPVSLDNEQILNLIGKALVNFMPKVPIEVKEEVFEWMTSEVDTIKKIDFRQFKFAVGMFLAYKGEGAWKISVKRSLNF